MRRKLLSCLLTLCMLFSLLPTAALAADANPFTDVKDADWFYDGVLWAEDEGLMNGTTATTFAPNDTTTRGMLVTILWRLAGKPDAKGEQFDDVDDGAYYADATVWGCANDIICGYGDGNFGPNDAITRQQMATILYRYAKYAKYDVTAAADLSDYDDADEVASWAEDALAWANAEGLINGMTEDTLVPAGNATRAQVAAILYRMTGLSPAEDDKPSSSGSSSGGHTHKWGEWTSNGDGTHTRVCTKNENHTQKANCTVSDPVFENGKFVYTCEECGKFTSDALLVYDAGDMDLIQTYLTGDLTVKFMDDIDMSGETWTPITVDGAAGAGVLTINGNDKTITGLDNMLIASTWAGKSGVVINDLTLSKANIVVDAKDAAGNKGVGAFIGWPQASETVTLNNCHLVDSHVEGGHWTGGLIGIAAGYSGNDGPVFETVTITGCSVKDSEIVGKGSVGGIIGHSTASAWTKVVIEDCEVTGNTITSTGDSDNKAGSVLATVGVAGLPTTADGETKTGGTWVNNATVEDNTVTSNGTAIETIYGRQGSTGGMLYIDGVAVDFGDTVSPVYVGPTGYSTMAEALTAAATGDTVTIMSGEHTLTSAAAGKALTFVGAAEGTVINCPAAIALHGSELTFQDLTIQGVDANYIGWQHTASVSFTNCTIKSRITLYADTASFTDCVFEGTGDYLWTYGADDVTFTNCEFNNANSKAILVYQENDTTVCNVTLTDCIFTAGEKAYTGSGDWTAAVEIDSSLAPANVVINNCTADENYNGIVRQKNGTNATVTVDGVYQVSNGAQLKALIEGFEDGTEATIALTGTEYTTTEAISVGKGKDITIQGTEGTTLTTWFKVTGELNLKDISLVAPDTDPDIKTVIDLTGEGDVNCENVTFDMSTAVDDSTVIAAWWSTGKGANITVTDCTFNCAGNRPIRSDACVTVENCTFNDPYRYAVQMTSKSSTMVKDAEAVVNFNNNTINAGTTNNKPVYGVQLEGELYGCSELTINGKGNTIDLGETGKESAMYYCECGAVDHATTVWNTEVPPVHEDEQYSAGLLAELYKALEDGKDVTLPEDVSGAAVSGGYSKAGLLHNGSTIDGNGNTLTISDANSTWDCAIYTTGGTIKNLTIGGAFRGIFTADLNENLVVDNCTIDNVCYPFNSDGANKNYSVIFKDTTLNGWTSYNGDYKSVSFTDCTFGKGTGGYQYAYLRPYSDTTLTGCAFSEGYELDATKTNGIVLADCTVGGVVLTQLNLTELLGKDAANATVLNDGVSEISDGFGIDAEGNYVVSNAAGMVYFAAQVNEEGKNFKGETVLLADDIDLNNEPWTPIGQTGSTEFKGVFDGQGYTIKNLYIDSTAETGAHYSSGLFGWLENHGDGIVIKNVNVDGATVKGNHNCAVIAGYVYGTIENCHVTDAEIVCTHANDDACGDKAGVIAGYAGPATDGVKIIGCSAEDCTVTAGRDAGQLVGTGYAASLTDCEAVDVTVTAGGDCTGANVNEALIGRVMD